MASIGVPGLRSMYSSAALAALPLLARQRLQAMGIGAIHGNDGSWPWCTFSQEERFFSYRRQQRTGRMAAMVWIRG